MEINQATVRELHQKLDEVLNKFAADNDLVVGKFKITYSPETGEFWANKVLFAQKDKVPSGVDPRYMRGLESRGWRYGLSAADVGRKLNLRSRHAMKGAAAMYEFVGIHNSKAAMKAPDGTVVLWPAETIAALFSNLA